VLDLATAFDQDLGGTTQAVGQLMKTGLAKDADEALDVLTRGFQQGADRSQDLLDTMTEYSVQFAKFGLDATSATGLLVQGMQAGARNSDLVADAIKEFSIRAVDGSALTAQGFKAIGLNAGEMASKIARGGPEATGALDLVLDRLRAMPDPVARSQAAVALFGTQAEDLGQALYALDPSSAVKSLGDVAGAADRMGATLNDSAGTRLVAFQRTLETGLVNFFGGVILPALQTAVQWIKDNSDWLAPLAISLAAFATAYGAVSGAIKLYELATKGAAAAQWLLNVAMEANPVGLIIGAIAAVVAAFVYFWQTSAGFRDFWIGVWGAIQTAAVWVWQNALKPAFDGIAAGLRVLGQVAGWLWSNILEPVFSFVGKAAAFLAPILLTVLIGPTVVAFRALAAVATWLWSTVLEPTFSALGAFFGWLWGTLLKPYFDAWVFAFRLVADVATWLWVNALGPTFRALGDFFGWLWTTLLKPAFDGWVLAFRLVGDAASWLYDRAIKPAFDAISGTLSWVYDHVIRPVFGWFADRLADAKRGFELLADTTRRVFDTIAGFIKTPVQFVIDVIWNNGLRKVYNSAAALIPGVDELPELRLARGGVLPGYAPGRDTVPALLSPGEAVLVPELVRAIGPAAILAANAAAMQGRAYSRGGLVGRFAGGGIVGTATTATAVTATTPDPAGSTVATEALTAASAVLADTVTTVLLPALAELGRHTSLLLPLANGIAVASLLALQATSLAVWTAVTGHSVLRAGEITARQLRLQADLAASWAGISAVVWASATAQNTAFTALGNGLAALRTAVAFTAGWVRDRFAEMQGHASGPVRWILQWPVNSGLVAAWNKLNADFSLGKAIGPVPIAFASGGPVPGAGNTDKVPAMLTPGEYVLPKKVVQTWGVGNIKAAHLAALHGNFPGLEGLLGDDLRRAQVVPGYRAGGLVADTGSAMDAAIARVVQFGRSMSGRPYVWGGSSTEGTDCSGWQAMLKRAALDQKPYARREWATGSVSPGSPPPGFVPGINGTFAIGVTHGSPGHTAGTVAGINAESGGAHGYVAFGPPSAGADHPQFDMHFHIAELGGQFVSGGGGFDPAALVDGAFADTYRMVDETTRVFPGTIAAQHGQGIARQATDGAKRHALGTLTALYNSTAGAAGSPEVVAAVRAVATRYGWGAGQQWDALSWLIGHESSWNPNAANPRSSARGLFQKMTSVHGPVEPTAAGQAEWGLRYISSRYRDPLGAKGFWQEHHWYDQGGWLQPGFTPVYNGSGKPELVLPHDTAQGVIGALQGNSGPVRLVGELSLSDDGLTAFVDGRIEQNDQATGTAIARGVRI
jgi:hypothetical protein